MISGDSEVFLIRRWDDNSKKNLMKKVTRAGGGQYLLMIAFMSMLLCYRC
jgi:hypothetical protein